jgi:ATP-dependent helicase YprA (DUF1998 family)
MLNPVTYTEQVVADFLRYQLTTYPFSDERLHNQMRRLLNLEETRNTPLLRGPFVSLSQSFQRGAKFEDLIQEGLLHPHIQKLTPYEHAYGHQEKAFRSIANGRTTLVATGTGSGKTESFLYPIISHCLKLRDQGTSEGIVAVLVYPMNALAEDQLGRLRELLAGTGVSFGMYVGKTPETAAEVQGIRLKENSSRADYLKRLEKARSDREARVVHPPEERVSRQELRTPGRQPRILLTNVKQLELLLTRQRDVDLFDGSQLSFLVFDEAHTFSGAQGAETAVLVRRLRAFCGKKPEEVVCVATSATIADPERGVEAGREFAARFFGVDPTAVALVGEAYEKDAWSPRREVWPPLTGNPGIQLQNVLNAVRAVEAQPELNGSTEPLQSRVEAQHKRPGSATPSLSPEATSAMKGLQGVFTSLTGRKLGASNWQEMQQALYDQLASNDVVYHLAQLLTRPKHLPTLVKELAEKAGRPVPEEEVLLWLALGAVARSEGRPLLRPVIHAFIRGMSGAVVTFPLDHDGPQLWLSREEAVAGGQEKLRMLDVTTCTTCGQHYFVHAVEDFSFTGSTLTGGRAEGESAYWPSLDPVHDGKRVVLVDELIASGDDDDTDHLGMATVFLCRHCGGLHRVKQPACSSCGRGDPLVELNAIRQSDKEPGQLTKCLSCGAYGRRMGSIYREPARPVRAITVSDVHVLGQNMLQYAERKRLIIFADNRQDAAFQAGWMQDHARRYRLRALMFQRIRQSEVSIGDLVAWLDDHLDKDDELSAALLPEVWRAERKEKAGHQHAAERKFFLRCQVLREASNGLRQRIGLEPWGRVEFKYLGLDETLPFVQRWAHEAQCTPEEMAQALATLLDISRRSSALFDMEGEVFTRWWSDGDREVQRGYVSPPPGGPRATVLERDGGVGLGRLTQWRSSRGQTRAIELSRKWGIPPEHLEDFLREAWALLAEQKKLLVPVTLKNQWKRPIPNAAGAHQVDADKLLMTEHSGLFRCQKCQRTQVRKGPHAACIQWRCEGTVVSEPEDKDNYDLMVLDQNFTLARPREHSAQVPTDERERLERQFKSGGEAVNTLIATPTLELGVDIGSLDAVLMRNVPPLAANYWQRAGRAGRRHRMAVNLTYCSGRSHDRAYFNEPLKLLDGRIDPPRFNLKNGLMVRKHVHATVLSVLFQLGRDRSGLPDTERRELQSSLAQSFPEQIKGYLFGPTGGIRRGGFDVSPLAKLVTTYKNAILEALGGIFSHGRASGDCLWPEQDQEVVQPELLEQYVLGMPGALLEVIDRLEKRLVWAQTQLERLEERRRKQGVLEPAEEALRDRCERLIKKLKGMETRRRQEAEGYDDTLTYSVLAAEGFLPGYGLDDGSILAFHQAPRYAHHLRDFQVRRPLSLALREYVPGNLLYANGHRFYPRYYQLHSAQPGSPIGQLLFQVDAQNEAVRESQASASGTGSATLLPAVAICDVDVPHQSHIGDDEDYRFQMPVAIYGHEQERHGGGRAYRWGERELLHRRQVHMRLVNVGPSRLVRDQGRFGYPLCLVCGQSRSPFASQTERDNFEEAHLQRCGQRIQNVGFYADDIADALMLQGCADPKEAYSLAEALRQGATEVLEMEREDLQVLTLPRPGGGPVDVMLYDPMTGGSGLLDQMIQQWEEVVAAALRITEQCPAQCDASCIDCLQNYRNQWSHQYLDRKLAAKLLKEFGSTLNYAHDIPAKMPAGQLEGRPVNEPEAVLKEMLLRAGFPEPLAQKPIDLGLPPGKTTPDFFYEDPNGDSEGICIYLDGLSEEIHGNPEAQHRDQRIREHLRNEDYEVIAIPVSDLTDRSAMSGYLARLARYLIGKDAASKVKADTSWFEATKAPADGPAAKVED